MKKLLFVIAAVALTAAPVAAAPPSLSLKAVPTVVGYGGSSTLSGVLSTQKAGAPVDVLAAECGQSVLKKVASAPTDGGGAFSVAVKPAMNTRYEAKQKSATSPTVDVQVSPLVSLKKSAGGAKRKFVVRVTAAQPFTGKYVVVQRRGKTKWSTIKKVTLATAVATTAPTQVTSARLALRLTGHPRLRAILPATQAGACYLAAKSAAIRS